MTKQDPGATVTAAAHDPVVVALQPSDVLLLVLGVAALAIVLPRLVLRLWAARRARTPYTSQPRGPAAAAAARRA